MAEVADVTASAATAASVVNFFINILQTSVLRFVIISPKTHHNDDCTSYTAFKPGFVLPSSIGEHSRNFATHVLMLCSKTIF